MSQRDPAGVNQHAARRGPSAGVIIIGVVVLAIVAVAAFVFLKPDRSEPPVGAASSSPSASASPSSAPTATPEPTPQPTATPAAQWEMGRVFERGEDPATDANVFGVVWYDGPGWIAYGLQENTEDGPPGIWTSEDGLSWTLAELPSGLEGHHVADIVRADVDGTPRYVAALGAFTRSAILISDDGLAWERAATPDTPTGLQAIAHGPGGFVAAGAVTDQETFASSGRIWQSTDGMEWAESSPAAFEAAQPLTIEVVGDRYVVVGFPSRESPPFTAWSSSDALEWSPMEIVQSSGVGCICAATGASDALMVALGHNDDVFAAISEDGTNWDVTVLDEASSATSTGADVVDGSIVATAAVDIADGPQDALIFVRDQDSTEWRSVDWRAELPDANEEEIDLGRPVYVAIGQERTLVLIADGTVFLTADPLP